MDDSATPLPTTLEACHAMIAELTAINAQQQATIAEQQALLQAMQRDIALMKRTLFGQRRERFEDPRQGTLFDAVVVGGSDTDDTAGEVNDHADNFSGEDDDPAETDDAKSSRRGGRGRRVIPESLPRVRRVHELDEAAIPEPLRGDKGRRFLKKIGEYVEWEPPKLMVVEEFVETLAVDNDDATETAMVSAPRPPRILTCFAGPSLLAGLATHHFADHQPYYRLEEILGRSQLEIDRSTVCRWMIRLTRELTPLTDLMRSRALESPVVQADETPIKMLAPGTGKTQTTYLWAILGDKQHPYTTFSFTESRARAGPAEFFADFHGTLVSDAYIGYEFLQPYSQGRIVLAGCHAHARRKFEELHALGPTQRTATAMGYFQRLFDIEDELRDVSDEVRHQQRQLRSRELLTEFKRWMNEQLETLRPKHDLRGAIQYMTSRWECFERFLESGAIPFDNNASEQAVKNPVMGKKAWLFFGSPAGGAAAAVMYTLTATCRRLRIDPYAYLRDVFERLPQLRSNSRDLEDSTYLLPLLPDRWLAEHPESALPMRTKESKDKAVRRRNQRTQRRRAIARANRKR
ncbi:MAG: IS66 family transposase [Planctomycetaceae bacterium]|nr:IS66 family transposase [Planctomycetaceae bacterium]